MGTSNFHNVNAKCIYPVLMDYERLKDDEDGNETDEFETVCSDEFEREFLIEFLNEKLTELNLGFTENYGKDEHELRSYSSRVIGTIEKSKVIGGLNVTVELVSVLRYAYYEGANLDWDVRFLVDGDIECEIGDFINNYEYNSEFKGIGKKHAETAYNWAETTKKELVLLVEYIYTEASGVKLKCIATASNGESFYQNC